MPAISPKDATEQLRKAILEQEPDDILETYYELFPRKRGTTKREEADVLLKEILEHFDKGLYVEEIMDLWHITFPGQWWGVWFDEEEEMIHYNDERAPALDTDD